MAGKKITYNPQKETLQEFMERRDRIRALRSAAGKAAWAKRSRQGKPRRPSDIAVKTMREWTDMLKIAIWRERDIQNGGGWGDWWASRQTPDGIQRITAPTGKALVLKMYDEGFCNIVYRFARREGAELGIPEPGTIETTPDQKRELERLIKNVERARARIDEIKGEHDDIF